MNKIKEYKKRFDFILCELLNLMIFNYKRNYYNNNSVIKIKEKNNE